MKNIASYETFFNNCGFEIPVLNQNMRNSSNVVNTFDSVYGFEMQYEGRDERCKDAKKRDHVKMVVDKASLPPNTVQGLRSVVVPVEGGSNRRFHLEPFDALDMSLKHTLRMHRSL